MRPRVLLSTAATCPRCSSPQPRAPPRPAKPSFSLAMSSSVSSTSGGKLVEARAAASLCPFTFLSCAFFIAPDRPYVFTTLHLIGGAAKPILDDPSGLGRADPRPGPQRRLRQSVHRRKPVHAIPAFKPRIGSIANQRPRRRVLHAAWIDCDAVLVQLAIPLIDRDSHPLKRRGDNLLLGHFARVGNAVRYGREPANALDDRLLDHRRGRRAGRAGFAAPPRRADADAAQRCDHRPAPRAPANGSSARRLLLD